MAVNEDNKKSKVSIWFLYIGIFLCASGIGIVVGLIFIAYWGIKTLEQAEHFCPAKAKALKNRL